MNEHIKTGKEITKEIIDTWFDDIGVWKQQWVSLSWLKEHKNFKVKAALEILLEEKQ
jgi:hypothetical protein